MATTTTMKLLGTSIGKKAIMAVTGVILAGFVVVHLLGNLQIFLGRGTINAYAEFLSQTAALAWPVRVIMLVAVLLHIVTALQLIAQKLRARPSRYRRRTYTETTISSRWMIWTGPLLALYVVYHLLHQTFGTVHQQFISGDVYHNLVVAFSDVPIAAGYMVAMVILGLHLKHGVWSLFQTLGLNSPVADRSLRILALLAAVVLAAGYISIPVAVLAGLVH